MHILTAAYHRDACAVGERRQLGCGHARGRHLRAGLQVRAEVDDDRQLLREGVLEERYFPTARFIGGDALLELLGRRLLDDVVTI